MITSGKHNDEFYTQLLKAVGTMREQLDRIERSIQQVKSSNIKHSKAISHSNVKHIAVINGEKQIVQDYNEDDFDVVLNLVKSTLKSRRNPISRSSLKPCKISPRPVQIFAYMLENPYKAMNSKETDNIFTGPECGLDQDCLRKTISNLRKSLGHGKTNKEYILTNAFSYNQYNISERGYRLNERYNYLLIKSF